MQVRDPIVELQETGLFKALDVADKEYAERISLFVKGVAPILDSTKDHFPYYTRHDAHHGFRVTRRIEQVIKHACLEPGTPECLGPAEIFLLIAAAYAHDLGMTVFPGEKDALLPSLGLDRTTEWKTNTGLQDHLRAEHSRRGGTYILQNADSLGVPLNLVGALDLMMQAHNLSIAKLDGVKTSFAAQERLIDVRQLGAIVCIADALEFSDTRVVDGVLAKISADPSERARVSYRENMKHVCIGDSLAIDNGRVIVSGVFSEAPVIALAHHTLDQMEGWVQGYCDIDRRSRRPRLGIRAEPFERNFMFTGGRFERLGVRLNTRSVIDLIASNAVWRNNVGTAVRELVQNAVEACRYRQHLSSPADRYSPAVTVTFDRAARTVTVEDNGCGMSERVVLNNLLTVGNSRAKESGYVEADYAPIARFGIGFWSVFTVASKVVVASAAFEDYRGAPDTTANADGISFEVSLDELKDYTIFGPIRRPCGTRVILMLREDAKLDEVYSQGMNAIVCSEVPVTMVLDGQNVCVPLSAPDVSDAAVVGGRTQLLRSGDIHLFRWRGEQDETVLSLAFVYRMIGGKASFLASPGASLMTAIGGHRSPRTSVCGFAVPVRPEQLCLDLFRVGSLAADNRSPRGFEFSLDRQQLLPNDASRRFARNIADLVHSGYRSFLSTTNSFDLATVAALHEQSCMHGGNVVDQFTGSELSVAVQRYPDLLSFRLYPVYPNEGSERSAEIYVGPDDLRRLTGVVFSLHTRVDVPINGAQFYSLDPEQPMALQVVLEAVRNWMRVGTISGPAYVMECNRLASMLFDADPDSTIRFVDHRPFRSLPIQCTQLERVRLDCEASVLVQFTGRWTGAVYLRDIDHPNGKPYIFLGRHRVVVRRSSMLAKHLQELVRAGKTIQVSEAIADLKEDEAGFTPERIRHLL